MAWDRACKAEYDAWKMLGDPDNAWDWDSILPYLLASEGASTDAQAPNDFASMSLSDKDVVNIGLSDAQTIGRDGPIKVNEVLDLLFGASDTFIDEFQQHLH
jgi:hypothetical protein